MSRTNLNGEGSKLKVIKAIIESGDLQSFSTALGMWFDKR